MNKRVNYKAIAYFIMLIVFCSCEDNTNNPIDNSPKTKLFKAEVGTKWVMEKDGKEGYFNAMFLDSAEWLMDYWDGTPKHKFQTICLEWKEYSGSLAKFTDYGLVETDSGYFFGTKMHYLVNSYYQTDFYVKLFFIPNKPRIGTVQEEFKKTVLGEERSWNYKATWSMSKEFFPQDTLRNVWKVEYLAEEKIPKISKFGDDFWFMEGVGFYKFRNHILKYIEK